MARKLPYKVTVTCKLTPPHDLIAETHHTSEATAAKAAAKAHRLYKGAPGLRIVVSSTAPRRIKTSWQRVLSV